MSDFVFTADEIANLMAVSIDHHIREEAVHQSLQDRVLLKKIESSSKGFPGGNELITWSVIGKYTSTETGFRGNQRVTFANPANNRRAQARWYNRHVGIETTFEELQRGGFVVTNTTVPDRPTDQKQAAANRLQDLWKDKLDDMAEGRAISRSRMFWGDGSQSTMDVPGIKYWVSRTPTVAAVVGGIDQGANSWWRNRAQLGVVANLSNASSQVLIDLIQGEVRQLRRFGGRPNCYFCGSDFLTQLERELRARGTYTDTGWASKGGIDVAVDNVKHKGMTFEYEPELDTIGEAKFCYILEVGPRGIQHMHMNGWRDRTHTPAREHDSFVIRQSLTTTEGLIARRRNGCGVYSIA